MEMQNSQHRTTNVEIHISVENGCSNLKNEITHDNFICYHATKLKKEEKQ